MRIGLVIIAAVLIVYAVVWESTSGAMRSNARSGEAEGSHLSTPRETATAMPRTPAAGQAEAR